jgi:phenylalanyl-tRNA synthetase beta chain
MLIPFSWLTDFIKTEKSPEEIAHILTMLGLEVEGIETDHGEVVFDIGITPNRPDCLNLAGIARELRASTGEEIILPEYSLQPDFTEDFKISIDSHLCRRYAGRIIRDVTIEPSPEWMARRLELSGLRPINNVVDITNYVLLEFGHPLHAFDLDTLKGKTIRVDTSGNSRILKTLDSVERQISENDLLIWDGERPVAIAGIMGGLETEVTEKTINVFLESAYFDPISIRRTSRRLSLKTEASYRFERGTDIEGLITALDRAAFLMKQLCGGRVSQLIDVYPGRYIPGKVTLRFKRIEQLIGIKIPDERVIDILQSLDFKITDTSSSALTVEVPSFRVDIENETDLIEEVARHYGYEKIPVSLPEAPLNLDTGTDKDRTELLKDALLLSGFNEAINYSFMNPAVLDRLNIPEGDYRRSFVELINPLRKEDSALRTFLLPSLINNLLHNLFQGVRDIKLFEIAKVFQKGGMELPDETKSLGIVYLYTPGQRLWEDRPDVFYLLKGVVEKIFQVSNISDFSFVRTTEPFLHPGRSSDILVDKKKIGFIGILSPQIKARFDIREIKEDIGVVELNLDLLFNCKQRVVEYKPLPKFPAIRRDIALLVDKGLEAETILSLIGSYSTDIIEGVNIFDVYEGKNIPEGKKSVATSIIYRSNERTLKDEEVDKVHKDLIDYLIKKTGGQLRS